jgi:hypothetical protein
MTAVIKCAPPQNSNCSEYLLAEIKALEGYFDSERLPLTHIANYLKLKD